MTRQQLGRDSEGKEMFEEDGPIQMALYILPK
jgi:hypothetical protein